MKAPVDHIPGGFEVTILVYFIPFVLIFALVLWLRAAKGRSGRDSGNTLRLNELLKVINDDPKLRDNPNMENLLETVRADIASKN